MTLVAVYSAVKYARHLWQGILITVGAILTSEALVLAVLSENFLGEYHYSLGELLVGGIFVLFVFVMWATIWFAGLFARTRRLYVVSLEERAATLEREREHMSAIAVAEERNRIAREVHDIVAHSLAVMVAQADGARYALDSSPETTRAALETIGRTGRESLDEMRRLVGVLRDAAPRPGADGCVPPVDGTVWEVAVLGQLGSLIERFEVSGLVVERVDIGEPRPLSPTQQLTAYRIVQEALTNSFKHAGPGTRVVLTLEWQADNLAISVVDDGTSRVSSTLGSGGHGLVGMRERVELFGGNLAARPRLVGGFEIMATLPLRPLLPLALKD
jgi:signal transduction histidine kinase